MANKFNQYNSTGGDLTDGTADIFGATIGASNLTPSMPIKTDSNSRLRTELLLISDTSGLASALSSTITNPLQGDVDGNQHSVTDLKTISIKTGTNTAVVQYTGLSDTTINLPTVFGDVSFTGVSSVVGHLPGFSTVDGKSINDSGVPVTSVILQNGSVPMTAPLHGFVGSQALPGYSFDGKNNYGMYQAGTELLWSANGTNSLKMSNAYVECERELRVNLTGTLADPAILFTPTNQCGFIAGLNQVSTVCNGVQSFDVKNTAIGSNLRHSFVAGSQASPSIQVGTDLSLGIYNSNPQELAFVGGNNLYCIMDANGLTAQGYNSTTGLLQMTLSNVPKVTVTTGSVTIVPVVHIANGTSGVPSLGFTNDTITGFYLPNPQQIGITCGGDVGTFNSQGMIINTTKTLQVETIYNTSDPINNAVLFNKIQVDDDVRFQVPYAYLTNKNPNPAVTAISSANTETQVNFGTGLDIGTSYQFDIPTDGTIVCQMLRSRLCLINCSISAQTDSKLNYTQFYLFVAGTRVYSGSKQYHMSADTTYNQNFSVVTAVNNGETVLMYCESDSTCNLICDYCQITITALSNF
jgi:hypothetical protein